MQRLALLDYLATRILALPHTNPLRVAVDGVDAAGKTSLADELAAALRISTRREIIRASIDRFHNPREIRYRQGPDSPPGYYEDSFDLPSLKQKLLDPLGPNGERFIQTSLFDFRSDSPTASPALQVQPDAILIFDGIFLLRPELEGCWDYSIFLQVEFDTVLARAVHRDREILGGVVINRYTKRYIPAQLRYLETCRPAEKANIIIGNDDPQNPQLIRESPLHFHQ